MEPIEKISFKYIELFAGIGGFRSALDRLGGECVFASEIDPFATRAYKALYDGAPELHGDITQIDAQEVPDHDVLVGGFPCQAFSVAGQRKGFEDARGTLFFEIARIASAKQPRLMLLENVKGLLSHDGGKTFETMCAILNDIGYAIDFRVLNSKHFGVPQNRERIFIVAELDAEHVDWNVTGNDVVAKAKRRVQALDVRTFNFDWPENNEVTTRLRDVLETQVDEKYYLSEEKTSKLIAQLNEKSTPSSKSDDIEWVGSIHPEKDDYYMEVYGVMGVGGISRTLLTMQGGGREPKIVEPVVMRVGNTNPSGNGMNGNVFDSNGLSPTLTTNKGEGVKVTEEVRAVLTPDREEKRQMGRRFKENDEAAFTLNTQDKHGVAIGSYPRYRIRKLTPRECWRLQGFTDAQHDTVMDAGISDSQRYKQSGNAVTVNVIHAIGIPLAKRLKQEEAVTIG
nr:DNA (cytosine-5-)-methyltransferase [Paenibacillus dakarensis]